MTPDDIRPYIKYIGIFVLLMVLSAGSILIARPYADEIFIYYHLEAQAGSSILYHTQAAIASVPGYLELGVFRPFSRILFNTEHWATFRLANFIGLSPFVVVSLVKIGSALLLFGSAILVIKQYFRAANALPKLKVFFAGFLPIYTVVAASLAVLTSPRSHPLNIFSLLYLGSAALSILTAVVLGAISNDATNSRNLKRTRIPILIALGVVLSGSIEIAYLGVPLALIHLLFIHLISSKTSPKTIKQDLLSFIKSRDFINWTILAVSFLLIVVPVKLYAANVCLTLDKCYRNAEMSLGTEAIAASALRSTSVINNQAISILEAPSNLAVHSSGLLLTVLLTSVAIVATYLYRSRLSIEKSLRLGKREHASIFYLLAFSILVVVLGAMIGGVSDTLQGSSVNTLLKGSWRDTSHLWLGTTMLVSTTIYILLSRSRRIASVNRRTPIIIASTLLIISFGATVLQNRVVYDSRIKSDAEGAHIQAAMNSFINFDRSSHGDDVRCTNLEPFYEYATKYSAYKRILGSINQASLNINGQVYCSAIRPLE